VQTRQQAGTSANSSGNYEKVNPVQKRLEWLARILILNPILPTPTGHWNSMTFPVIYGFYNFVIYRLLG